MTDFKVKDIHVFAQLVNDIATVEQRSPPLLHEVMQALEQLQHDLKVDRLETERQIAELRSRQSKADGASSSDGSGNAPSKDLQRQQSELMQKLEQLKGVESAAGGWISKFQYTKGRFTDALGKVSQGKSALQAFQQVAQQYLGLNTVTTNNRQGDATFRPQSNNSIRLEGDTFHISKGGKGASSLNQYTIDAIERDIKQHNVSAGSSEKGRKISIDNVTSSDFNVLEQNGYTIQQIGPNDYSAFKTIGK